MRVVTPAIDEAIRWFYWTHELQDGLGGARWTLARLPGEGALEAQDARLWQALEHLRNVANTLLARAPKKGADDELKTFHAGRRGE